MYNIPKIFYTIIPFKVVNSVISILIILLVISAGGGAIEVAIVSFLTVLGNLIGMLLWVRILSSVRRCIFGYLLGYLGISLSLVIILLRISIYSIYIHAVSISLSSTLVYISAVLLINEFYRYRLSEIMGLFEMIGGWAWVLGLAIGALSLRYVNPVTLIYNLLILSIATTLVISILIHSGIRIRCIPDGFSFNSIHSNSRYSVGYDESLTEVGVLNRDVVFKLSKFRASLYTAIFIEFLAFGLVYSQIVKFIHDLGYTATIIYLISLISSIVTAFIYPAAGRVRNTARTLVIMSLIRVVMFVVLTLTIYISGLTTLVMIVIFAVLDGYSWAYITVLLNVIALEVSYREIGYSNVVRYIGSIIGALLSGIVISLRGYQADFILATTLLIISIINIK